MIPGAMETATPQQIRALKSSQRIMALKRRMLDEPRYLSVEQAKIVTEYYRENPDKPRNIQRAESLAEVMRTIRIRIDPLELVVGNRTAGVRAGVVSPDAGISWVDDEIENLPNRPQDKFNVRPEDIAEFRQDILPFWKGKSLEDKVREAIGDEIAAIGKVVKINQTDHAQGHICPDVSRWLALGPKGIRDDMLSRMANAAPDAAAFYRGVIIVLEGAMDFMRRYASLASEMADSAESADERENLMAVADRCARLAEEPAVSFHDAIQSMWFLFALLQLESNASSFSPGRADQYLLPYYERDRRAGILDRSGALEIVEALWLKFNQIVYLRSSSSARYFAGFPIGFNLAIGGLTREGKDASNELSYLFLKAQEQIGLPQPNLSARLSGQSSEEFVRECARVIGLGSGMPQIFNDESIIPALEARGISHADAMNYAIVGCVELTTQGNNLGWSDAAMFNMVKALELTLNNGTCLLSGKKMGLDLGSFDGYETYEQLEDAFRRQMDHFVERMIKACDFVDRLHAELLPSPFLSSVIDGCAEKALDVTAGGARYNLSGIQAIQAANVADCLAVAKKCVYEDKSLRAEDLLAAIRKDYEGAEALRQRVINKVPKYGNDIEWVDAIAAKWVDYFAKKLGAYTNARGGIYHSGLYTVSAHVPMGQNVGASLDGRKAKDPLADGGMSAMYGRDRAGPTALLRSVSRIDAADGSNGTLLNMKFLPEFFRTEEGIAKFASLLRTFVQLHINHVQFNVVRKEDLLAAKAHPEEWRSLTVRVAGYTAYFVELANDLQDEIIARTSYGDI
ncbi:MAG TPA: formate C-acetyltransferase/glycerol dehydratase family glycyl radical enzyme [Rectinemataceae bacterium]|nr:formate C-acetyltransferase/glycerol dehydratase family glycyl radical enzyme [Rectinemataceae bacterium]